MRRTYADLTVLAIVIIVVIMVIVFLDPYDYNVVAKAYSTYTLVQNDKNIGYLDFRLEIYNAIFVDTKAYIKIAYMGDLKT